MGVGGIGGGGQDFSVDALRSDAVEEKVDSQPAAEAKPADTAFEVSVNNALETLGAEDGDTLTITTADGSQVDGIASESDDGKMTITTKSGEPLELEPSDIQNIELSGVDIAGETTDMAMSDGMDDVFDAIGDQDEMVDTAEDTRELAEVTLDFGEEAAIEDDGLDVAGEDPNALQEGDAVVMKFKGGQAVGTFNETTSSGKADVTPLGGKDDRQYQRSEDSLIKPGDSVWVERGDGKMYPATVDSISHKGVNLKDEYGSEMKNVDPNLLAKKPKVDVKSFPPKGTKVLHPNGEGGSSMGEVRGHAISGRKAELSVKSPDGEIRRESAKESLQEGSPCRVDGKKMTLKSIGEKESVVVDKKGNEQTVDNAKISGPNSLKGRSAPAGSGKLSPEMEDLAEKIALKVVTSLFASIGKIFSSIPIIGGLVSGTADMLSEMTKTFAKKDLEVLGGKNGKENKEVSDKELDDALDEAQGEGEAKPAAAAPAAADDTKAAEKDLDDEDTEVEM